MVWIIIFLGIIAISDAITSIVQLKSRAEQTSIELLTKQLQQEREQYARYKEQFDKDLAVQKDAMNLWAKKYYELESLLNDKTCTTKTENM